MIIGCGGSGKSTLAKQLANKLNLPVIHLDMLFWQKNWVQISNEEFDFLLKEVLEKDSWILDGNYNRTIKQRIDKCDTVIYLDYSRLACLRGVMKRVISNYGKVRSDMEFQ